MGKLLGSARRARKLARLFEAWRRAFDAQDAETMAAAKQAIDAMVAGAKPGHADSTAIARYLHQK
jgi:hypothetical protein